MVLSNKISYPQRLFLWLLAYSALLVGSFVVFQYHREKEFKADEINSDLQLVNTYILLELEDGTRPGEIDLGPFKAFRGLRVSVIDDKGEVVYDNTLDSLPTSDHRNRAEIKQALKNGSGYTIRRHSESTGDYYFYSATTGADGYVVRTAVPYSVSLSSLLQADYSFLWVMGLIAAGMCVLGYFATRRVGLHIMRLNRFAENVEKGSTISDTEPFPHDELGEISNHIVRLYAKLQQAYADRDNEHRAALHEQNEKQRIKKQLTNNINHELKTPVSSIRVCVETLLSHPGLDDEKRRHFLQRCLSATDRLERLLTDVALITRMEDGSTSIVREKTDLTEIIADVTDDRLPVAMARGIDIVNEVTTPLPMTGNRALLEAIFNNLIDNAIAYSGGSRITITSLPAPEGSIAIGLSDNGCGIPEEHLPRIFERFYRIDKGRSRAAGGTGLGLSIVKNAVAIHGGSISVANLNSGGLSFRINLSRES